MSVNAMWITTGRRTGPEGTTITYRLRGTPYTVESRRRKIPHANGVGTWEHTSFFVLRDGKELVEEHTLREARICAEDLYTWCDVGRWRREPIG